MRTTSINRQNWLWFLVAILMVSMVAPDFSFGGKGNETILVANFMNGNNAVFNSRVYLFNASKRAGNVTVRVFTLPISGGVQQELTVLPLSLGTLGPKSALNIRLDTDIMTPLGIVLPYLQDGGNVALEFKVDADHVTGLAQYFGLTLESFDSYPLQVI